MNKNPVQVRILSPHEAGDALSVRRQVFVVEQGVPEELERDSLDHEATHVAAYVEGKPVGAGRMTLVDGEAKIGRMAVLEEWRGQGVGSLILKALLDEARRYGAKRIFLHAQLAVQAFYERHGFKAKGDVFQEADMDHVLMEWEQTIVR